MKESFFGKGQQFIEVLRVKANLFIYAGVNENFSPEKEGGGLIATAQRKETKNGEPFCSHMPRGLNLHWQTRKLSGRQTRMGKQYTSHPQTNKARREI